MSSPTVLPRYRPCTLSDIFSIIEHNNLGRYSYPVDPQIATNGLFIVFLIKISKVISIDNTRLKLQPNIYPRLLCEVLTVTLPNLDAYTFFQ
jgi:hypothetical protein